MDDDDILAWTTDGDPQTISASGRPDQRYMAGGTDCGCIVWTCGHKHRTPGEALECGDRKWWHDGTVAAIWWTPRVVIVEHPEYQYVRPANGVCTIPPNLDNQARWRRRGRRVMPTAKPKAYARVAMMCESPRIVALYDEADTVAIVRKKQAAR